jgi:hypothetical protein
LSVDDINQFYKQALRNPHNLLNPDLSRLDTGMREKVENDVNAIQSTFSPRQLLSGAEILRSLSVDLRASDQKKVLRFVRKGYIAWILRYVNLKSTGQKEECQ